MSVKLTAIFGKEPAREFTEFGRVTELDGGCVTVLEFKTAAERNAYQQGLEDALGWEEVTYA